MKLDCRVCQRIESQNAHGWKLCVIDVRGDFYSTDNLDLETLRHITPMVMGAYVCGQTHALVLYERFLDRGTFEPVHADGAGWPSAMPTGLTQHQPFDLERDMPRSTESLEAERKFAQRLILAALAILAFALMFGCAGSNRPIRLPRPSPPVLRGPIHF